MCSLCQCKWVPQTDYRIYPRRSWRAGRALAMKSLVVMVLPPGQVQEVGMALSPLPPQGGPVTDCGWKVEPSRHVQKEGSTPRPQFGRLYWLITLSARSLIWNVLPLGQVHWSGRALPEQGLLRYSMENGMLSPLVHWHVDGGTLLHGFKLLFKILLCITVLFKMFWNPAPTTNKPADTLNQVVLRGCKSSRENAQKSYGQVGLHVGCLILTG